MALRDLTARIRITADTKGVSTGLKSAETSVTRFKTGYVAAAAAIAAATAAIVKGFQQLREGATLAAQERALETQLGRVGEDLDQFLAKLTEVSQGTLSTAEAIQASSSALLLGIPADKISALLEIARKSAAATGQEIGAAFNDIAKGIGRASPLILDNLGIIVKIGEANRVYAEQLGKSTEQLTAAEQKQALLNQVLDVGATAFEGLDKAISPTADALDRFVAGLDDTLNSFKKAAADSSLLAGAFDQLNVLLFGSQQAWEQLNPEVALQIDLRRELIKLEEASTKKKEEEIKLLVSMGGSFDTLNDQIGDQVDAFDLLVKAEERYLRLTAQAAEETEDYEAILKKLGVTTDVELNDSLTKLNGALETNARLYGEGAISAEQYDRAQGEIKNQITDLTNELNNTVEATQAKTRADEVAAVASDGLKDSTEDLTASTTALRAELVQTTAVVSLTANAFDRLAAAEGRAAAEQAALAGGATLSQGGRRINFRGGGSRLVRTNAGVQSAGGFFGETGQLRSPIFDDEDN